MRGHVDPTAMASGERRFRAIFEASPDCIKLVSAEGGLIDINAAGLRMIEAECADQLHGQNLFDLIDPAYHQSFRDCLDAVFAGKTTRLQFEVVTLSGRRLFMDQTAAPLFASDGSGRVVEMVAVTRNVSAERRAEAELLQARLAQDVARAAAERAASLGQELNTPLDAIIGYSELVLEAVHEQGHAREAGDMKRVLDAAHILKSRLCRLVQTALAETRGPAQVAEVDDLLEAAAAAARPLAQARGNRIDIALGPERLALPEQTDMLAQCLRALLSRAIEQTQDGIITIKARPMHREGSPRLVVSVIDTGPGLSPAELETVFDGGVGHGSASSELAAARRLALLMGGDIAAASAPGRGSRFTITLPVRSTRLVA